MRAAFASASAGAWNPFLRRIFYNMDNCAGTNKSQFCFGGIALLAMSGNLDTILLMFQLQGHTKLDPDIAAQKTAGAFNSRDTFNHGMLNNHFSDHVTTIAYDHKLLKDWKAATPDIFEPVDNITSYRNFMLLADDGKVDLGEPLKKNRHPSKGLPFIGQGLFKRGAGTGGSKARAAFTAGIGSSCSPP